MRDARGDTCEVYLHANSYQCGHFDTDEFSAFFHCCACQCVSDDNGGGIVDANGHGCDWYMGEYAMLMGTHTSPPSRATSYDIQAAATASDSTFGGGNASNGGNHNHSNYQQYQSFNASGNGFGDELVLVQDGGPTQCAQHDTEAFRAAEICCACGGGRTERSWEAEWTPAPPHHLTDNSSRSGDSGFYHDGSHTTPAHGAWMWSERSTVAPTPAPPAITG